MAVGSSSGDAAAVKPRWYAPTPARFLFAVLLMQGVLFLSTYFRWFWFNELKGYTVVLVVAATSVLLLLLVVWQLGRRLFGRKAQFSLASILLLILVVAIPCGWLTHELAITKQRRETLAAIDCSVTYDVDLTTALLPDDLHRRLRTALETVLGDDFFVGQVYVEVDHSADENARKIGALTHITALAFDDDGITDAGVAHLGGLTSLRLLRLSHQPITDAGVIHLGNLRELESLNLHNTKVTNAGLKHLAPLRRLEHLDLGRTQVTDEGLNVVGGWTQLKSLSLRGTSITDAGWENLKGLSRLRHLTLDNKQASMIGVKKLRAALPDCEFQFPFVGDGPSGIPSDVPIQ